MVRNKKSPKLRKRPKCKKTKSKRGRNLNKSKKQIKGGGVIMVYY